MTLSGSVVAVLNVMDSPSFAAAVLTFSILAQTTAAIMAIKLIRITGRLPAWGFIVAALLLMAVRRAIPLYHLAMGDVSLPPDVLNEVMGLGLSILMAIGIANIAPLFLERIRAEAELAKINRALRMLSDFNQAQVRIGDEPTLLNELCRCVIHVGGYHTAWIAYAERDDVKTLQTMALMRSGGDGLDAERGQGPGGIAVRTKKPCLVRNIQDNHSVMSRGGERAPCGNLSLIALPLTGEDRVFGALNISSGEAGAFDEREVALLCELASDLSFGIAALRLQAGRKRVEIEILHYKDQLEETVRQRTGELLLARDSAEAANKAKSIFLANMSHELRTPLNAILGFSNIMCRDPQLTESQRDNLNIINHSGEHLLSLINEVLDVAKIEAGRMQLEIAPFDLCSMVRDVIEMMGVRAREKALLLRLDQAPELPCYIKGDEARLRQVLVNLVSNAMKFTEQGGATVRLAVKPQAKLNLVIEVEDSGPGISPEDQKRLFKPFVQLEEGGKQQGTGLGLTISRQFVQLMGGSINLVSTLGKGSIFRVELPVEFTSEANVLKPERRGEVVGLAPGQPRYRILIAEDQSENQLLLYRLMLGMGLDVKIAGNGEQCVKLFQDWHPDLIWMDRRMPIMDGEEATRRIRQLPNGGAVKIVAVTASALKDQRQEMLDSGMDDVVRKPYRFEEIYASMARQLGIKYRYVSDVYGEDLSIILMPAMLTVLPPILQKELKEALESLDGERISATIQMVTEIDQKLGHILSRLAESFDYPTILKALENQSSGEDH